MVGIANVVTENSYNPKYYLLKIYYVRLNNMFKNIFFENK